jgi:hypothetical protein
LASFVSSQYLFARFGHWSEPLLLTLTIIDPQSATLGTLPYPTRDVADQAADTHAGGRFVFRRRMVSLNGGVNGVEQAKPVLIGNKMTNVWVLIRAIINLVATWTGEFHFQRVVVAGQQ